MSENAQKFLVASGSENRAGHDWLDRIIEHLQYDSSEVYEKQVREVKALDPALQVSILRACVERMPWYRQQHLKAEGAMCYRLACLLYASKPALEESDICALLTYARHTCGHGGDVISPFDSMINYARKNGVTSELLTATRAYLDNLKGINSVHAQNVKTTGALILTLDTENKSSKEACWSETFRLELKALPSTERRLWERFVADIPPTMLSTMPKTSRTKAVKFVKAITAETALARLSAWFPNSDNPTHATAVSTGGSHLLKHFIWLLEVIASDSSCAQRADRLVCELTKLSWKPQDKAHKILVTAAYYLAQRPPDVSWNALERIERWSKTAAKNNYSGDKLTNLISDYKQRFHLASENSVELV
ncbi:MAG TPA: hypothetical protein V6C89_18875 [Drouetiella sp.]|jgi:hypothetical protein